MEKFQKIELGRCFFWFYESGCCGSRFTLCLLSDSWKHHHQASGSHHHHPPGLSSSNFTRYDHHSSQTSCSSGNLICLWVSVISYNVHLTYCTSFCVHYSYKLQTFSLIAPCLENYVTQHFSHRMQTYLSYISLIYTKCLINCLKLGQLDIKSQYTKSY